MLLDYSLEEDFSTSESAGLKGTGDSVSLPSSACGSLLVVVFGKKLADRGVVVPSSQNSTSPSALRVPFFTNCPFSRIRSSTVTDLSENI